MASEKSHNSPQSGRTRIIIEGITESGEYFRPSDWAERMSGSLSTYRKHHIYYSPMLQPSIKNGNKCIILDPELAKTNPELYESILNFAKLHNLKMHTEDQSE